MYLFFDTETTGLIDRNLPLDDPSQARILQLAAKLVSEKGEVIDQLCTYIKPEASWPPIHEKAFAAHGISIEKCEAEGIPMPQALAYFNSMKARCSTRVAFNISFDKQMLHREALAYDMVQSYPWQADFCVMQATKEICNMAPTQRMIEAGISGSKPPKLTEAYRFFFGRDFDGAHDAMADVEATIEIFFKLKEI